MTEALAWFDKKTDCNIPRPHSPRKALEMCVIAGCGKTGPLQTFLYAPEKDEFYRLPERPGTDIDRRPEHVFACRGNCSLYLKTLTEHYVMTRRQIAGLQHHGQIKSLHTQNLTLVSSVSAFYLRSWLSKTTYVSS